MDADATVRSLDGLATAKRKRPHDGIDGSVDPPKDNDLVTSRSIPYGEPSLGYQVTKKARLENILEPPEPPSHPGGTLLRVTDLPPEILQHIFSFVHPITLGRLLSVCKLFSTLLDPNQKTPVPSPSVKHLSPRKPNDIWARSRTYHLPSYPRPLESLTELEMWSLLRVRRCQFCHRKAKKVPSFLHARPWSGGPGPDDVRAIWPFRIRSCGACLQPRLLRDKDLLLSNSSFLRPGLPFAVFTPSFNYVTSVNLEKDEPPAKLQLTKYFYRPDVDELENRVIEVRGLGDAVVEEWSKGLETSGKARQDEAARLEKWELSFAAQLHIGPTTFSIPDSTMPSIMTPETHLSAPSHASSTYHSHDVSMTSPPRPSSAQSSQLSGFTTATSLPPGPEMPLQPFTPAPGQSLASFAVLRTGTGSGKAESVTSSTTARSQSKPRPKPQEVERLRCEKRADIEMRCQRLDPPIRPSVLPFMNAYNAAMQISMPLNDAAWDLLKSRLTSEREEAEHREREHIISLEASQLAGNDRRAFDERRRLEGATNSRIWAELGIPPRQKLKTYADDYISSIWDGGLAVTAATSAKFAAEVLLHVRRRFDEGIVEEDKLLASRDMRIPGDSGIPEMRRLKLDDMKWVYEESVRPHTERFGKETFLCSTCENTAKRFTFDAVIQHYAAKHTKDLSKGNQVVHWKAQWPRDWPFHTSPDSVWHRPPHARSPMRFPYAASPGQPSEVPTIPRSPASSLVRNSIWEPDQPPRPRNLYDEHCDEVSEAAVRALDATENIKGLPDSVRLYVIMHYVARLFWNKFRMDPKLPLFADCVSQRPPLRQIKDFHGLRCRACRVEGRNFSDQYLREYWLTDLLDHFQRCHIQHSVVPAPAYRPLHDHAGGIVNQRLDWLFDMVELPHEQIIRNLHQVPGMDAAKFEMLRSIFPAVFTPVPAEAARASSPAIHDQMIASERGVSHQYSRPRYVDESIRQSELADFGYRSQGVRPIYEHQFDGSLGFAPSSSEFVRRPGEYRDSYGARREIVYFDDARTSMQRTTYPTIIRQFDGHGAAQRPKVWHEDDDARYEGRHSLPLSRGPADASRGLPFRPHHLEMVGEAEDAELEPGHSPHTGIIHTAGLPTQQDEGEHRDEAMTDAEVFLNNFDPLASREDDHGASMSRTASIRHRNLVDDENASVMSGRLSHSATPARLRQEGLLSRTSISGSHGGTPVATNMPHQSTRSSLLTARGLKQEPAEATYTSDAQGFFARPRTPPASLAPRRESHTAPLGESQPLFLQDMDPSTGRNEYNKHIPPDAYLYSRAAPHLETEDHGRRQHSPEHVHMRHERAGPVHYVEVPSNQRRVVQVSMSPEVRMYERARVRPGRLYYVDDVPHITSRDHGSSNDAYSGDPADWLGGGSGGPPVYNQRAVAEQTIRPEDWPPPAMRRPEQYVDRRFRDSGPTRDLQDP
ncbi:uncharacterized protein HMPREF1541_08070 [Cyphellophora europaea CBS 101466]|uniref:F-box domain-containing protein n=1 Tax=Cyphellophora europaea (strain CBS 101466) TaxID=1220924 RepID=W2RL80_CYPE1|nr:uncharacterized protein HMPREF1541_08070 [Cyphellophora europaea CBS 101466]ETN37080.1 hypothetical protein HMPREF1541_08070 [Cyphellophora europaea CBS 101466]